MASSMLDNVTSVTLRELKAKSPEELLAYAEELEVENASSMRTQDMLFAILKELADSEVEITGQGVLEVLTDGFGFLRSPESNYLPGPDDIYVSPEVLKKGNIRTGDTVEGPIVAPQDSERYFALTDVSRINFEEPDKANKKVHFDNLTPLYPEERLRMESQDPTRKDRSGRVIDIVAPIGKGQRALIVAPPRTGKTVLLQNIASAIEENHPECYLIVLLIDERPEEVTDMRRTVKGEVVASTFDEPATRHVQVAEMVIEKAKRLPSVLHCFEELVVRLRLAQLVDQEVDRIIGAHRTKDPAKNVDLRQLVLRRDQLFFPRTGLHDVDGRESPLVSDLPVEHDFRVTRAFEFLEDNFVHTAAGIDQRGCHDGQRSAVFHVPRSTEETLRTLQGVGVDTTGQNLAGRGDGRVVGAAETRNRVEIHSSLCE